MPGNVSDLASQNALQAHLKESHQQAHKIWAPMKAYVDRKDPIVILPHDITADITWDGAEHALDLTSHTGPYARIALISFYIDRDGGDVIDPFCFRATSGGADFAKLCGDKHFIHEGDGSNFYARFGGTFMIPLDENQVVYYVAPQYFTNKSVFLLAYLGG